MGSVIGARLSPPLNTPDPTSPEAVSAFMAFADQLPATVPSGRLGDLYAAIEHLARKRGLPHHMRRHALAEVRSAVDALLNDRPELAPLWLACRQKLWG
jgi:hypothetical protein